MIGQQKIGFFTPYYKENRGNSTTAKRIKTGLLKRGIQVEIFAYEEDEWTETAQKRLDTCDVLHILHFYRFTEWMLKNNYKPKRPYIITSGGTDVNERLTPSTLFVAMEQFVKEAYGIVVFTEDAKEKLKHAFGLLQEQIHIIKQSVWFPEQSEGKTQGINGSSEGNPKILLPAGLRPVKDVLYLLEALVQLKKCYPELAFTIVGPIIDPKTYESVKEVERRHPWFHYGGNVSFLEMKVWYEWSDLVANSSKSEGQSSSLLEAMAMERVIMARNNPGNESLIVDGKNGVLFNDPEDFIHKFKQLMSDDRYRLKLIKQAKQDVNSKHGLDHEIDQYVELYRKALNKKEAGTKPSKL